MQSVSNFFTSKQTRHEGESDNHQITSSWEAVLLALCVEVEPSATPDGIVTNQ